MSIFKTQPGNVVQRLPGLDSGSLPIYKEGQWTPTENLLTNITGTGVYGDARYVQIGIFVFAQIDEISGYTLTTAGDRTFFMINLTGLPGVTNETTITGGGAFVQNGSPFATMLYGVRSDTSKAYIAIDSSQSSNGSSIIMTDVSLQYLIGY